MTREGKCFRLTHWSSADLERVAKLHAELGNQWVRLSRRLRTKTEEQVKNLFYSLQRRQSFEKCPMLHAYVHGVMGRTEDAEVRRSALNAALAACAANGSRPQRSPAGAENDGGGARSESGGDGALGAWPGSATGTASAGGGGGAEAADTDAAEAPYEESPPPAVAQRQWRTRQDASVQAAAGAGAVFTPEPRSARVRQPPKRPPSPTLLSDGRPRRAARVAAPADEGAQGQLRVRSSPGGDMEGTRAAGGEQGAAAAGAWGVPDLLTMLRDAGNRAPSAPPAPPPRLPVVAAAEGMAAQQLLHRRLLPPTSPPLSSSQGRPPPPPPPPTSRRPQRQQLLQMHEEQAGALLWPQVPDPQPQREARAASRGLAASPTERPRGSSADCLLGWASSAAGSSDQGNERDGGGGGGGGFSAAAGDGDSRLAGCPALRPDGADSARPAPGGFNTAPGSGWEADPLAAAVARWWGRGEAAAARAPGVLRLSGGGGAAALPHAMASDAMAPAWGRTEPGASCAPDDNGRRSGSGSGGTAASLLLPAAQAACSPLMGARGSLDGSSSWTSLLEARGSGGSSSTSWAPLLAARTGGTAAPEWPADAMQQGGARAGVLDHRRSSCPSGASLCLPGFPSQASHGSVGLGLSESPRLPPPPPLLQTSGPPAPPRRLSVISASWGPRDAALCDALAGPLDVGAAARAPVFNTAAQMLPPLPAQQRTGAARAAWPAAAWGLHSVAPLRAARLPYGAALDRGGALGDGGGYGGGGGGLQEYGGSLYDGAAAAPFGAQLGGGWLPAQDSATAATLRAAILQRRPRTSEPLLQLQQQQSALLGTREAASAGGQEMWQPRSSAWGLPPQLGTGWGG